MTRKGENERNTVIAPEETALFCEQIAMLLKSGILLGDGISALCDAYRGSRYGARFEALRSDVARTGCLYEAVRDSGLFPGYMVQMVRIGEKSGALEEVMASLASYYEREASLRRSIRSAVVYPLVLIAMMSVLIVVLAVKVMPVFEEVFQNMGGDMPASSRSLMLFGQTAGSVILVLLGALLILALVTALLLRTSLRQRTLDWLCRLLPAFRRINEKLSSARFAAVMGKLLTSGFPISEALDLIPDLMTDESTKRRAVDCKKAIEGGASFSDAVEKTRMFSDIYNKMIRVGNAAGQLDAVMNRLAALCEDEADEDIKRMAGVIEPLIVAFLAVVIGAILLSVMLPLASILSSVG